MTSHCNLVLALVVLLTGRKGTARHHGFCPVPSTAPIPRPLSSITLHNLRVHSVLSFMTKSQQHINCPQGQGCAECFDYFRPF